MDFTGLSVLAVCLCDDFWLLVSVIGGFVWRGSESTAIHCGLTKSGGLPTKLLNVDIKARAGPREILLQLFGMETFGAAMRRGITT
jgi:hypothetical protein